MTSSDSLWGNGVRISQPRLYRVNFQWDGAPVISEGSKARTEFHLGVHRLGEFELGVEFGASIDDVPGLQAIALYRMECSLIEGSPEREQSEEAFQSITARLAPTVIYPYVRETLSTLALKANLKGFVLPVVNFGTIYDPQDIDIPDVPAGHRLDSGTPREEST